MGKNNFITLKGYGIYEQKRFLLGNIYNDRKHRRIFKTEKRDVKICTKRSYRPMDGMTHRSFPTVGN